MPINMSHGQVGSSLSFPCHWGRYQIEPCSANETVRGHPARALSPAAPQFIPAQAAPAQVATFDHVQSSRFAGNTTGTFIAMTHGPYSGEPTIAQPPPMANGSNPADKAPFHTIFSWYGRSTWDAALIREYQGNKLVRIRGGESLYDPMTLGTFNPGSTSASTPGHGHGQPSASGPRVAARVYSAAFFIRKTRDIFAQYGFTQPLGIQAVGRVSEWRPLRRRIPTIVVTMRVKPCDKRSIEFAVYDCMILFQVLWVYKNVSVEVVDPVIVSKKELRELAVLRGEFNRNNEGQSMRFWDGATEENLAGFL
ncbi:uncharacterized protein BDV14DRAFT_200477 [Aspergillus stella-maris]|uniref:uncharacterized protein n=1 Tax=Aspergillus stella-maris TaxID=1810926 RepID=UPI003CCD468F